MSPEFREWLAKRAKPFELLAKVCRGDEIDDGGEKRRPTLPERMRAAETLGRKLLPDLAAQAVKAEVTGTDGAPLGGQLTDFEVGRRIAFLLAAGLHGQGAGMAALSAPAAPVSPPDDRGGAGRAPFGRS